MGADLERLAFAIFASDFHSPPAYRMPPPLVEMNDGKQELSPS